MPADDQPYDAAWIASELQEAADHSSFWRDRQDVNDRVRWCRWEHQSEDGRKWAKNYDNNRAPFPFEGASDVRVRKADKLVNKDVETMLAAFDGAVLKVAGTELNDFADAGKATKLLRWQVYTQMMPDARDELQLAVDWRQHHGVCVMRVDWHQETALERREMSVAQLQEYQQTAAQGGQRSPQIEAILAAVSDSANDSIALPVLDEMLPELSRKEAKQLLKDLRKDGVAYYGMPYTRENMPQWRALRVYEDVFFPTNTDKLQRARWVAEREWLTEAEVRDRENSGGWTPEFVEEVLKHKGEKSFYTADRWDSGKYATDGSYEWAVEDPKDLYEIFHVHYRANDDNGVPGIYVATYCLPAKAVAKEPELLDYQHGKYPYVSLVRERNVRGLLQSRGVGEIALTNQNEIKLQRDYQADRASMDILPPAKVSASRADMPIIFGPGVKVPMRRNDDIDFFDIPSNYNGSQLVLDQSEREVDEYFGGFENDSDGKRRYMQGLVSNFLSEMREVFTQTFQLMQQYTDDIDLMLVIGGQPQQFKVSRQEIQGRYDLQIQFDVRDLDSEFMAKKLDLISSVILPLDVEGVVDRTGLVKRLYQWIDPFGADEMILPKDAAFQKEVDAEQQALAKIYSGIEPPLNVEGTNAQLRMQVIQNAISKNPQLQQRYQQDEIYRGMIDARLEAFQFQLTQRQNEQIGRVGTQPYLAKANAEKAAQQ